MKKSENCPFCNPYDENASEMMNWLFLLAEYATGKKKWDTEGLWVCESHPTMPFEQGLSFDCKCGAPGMPPFPHKNNAKMRGAPCRTISREIIREER